MAWQSQKASATNRIQKLSYIGLRSHRNTPPLTGSLRPLPKKYPLNVRVKPSCQEVASSSAPPHSRQRHARELEFRSERPVDLGAESSLEDQEQAPDRGGDGQVNVPCLFTEVSHEPMALLLQGHGQGVDAGGDGEHKGNQEGVHGRSEHVGQ